MHCEVAEALSDKRPKEVPGVTGPGRGPSGLGAHHMAFRIAVSGCGGCGDGDPRDLLPRPSLPPPPPPPPPPQRAHDHHLLLLRPRSPRDYVFWLTLIPFFCDTCASTSMAVTCRSSSA
uniref:Uncharacterized protein n=1 Tax=Jaculus jaculus TaxID=51337 RepID=A0A8C5KAY6_JACJA